MKKGSGEAGMRRGVQRMQNEEGFGREDGMRRGVQRM